jgi:hypothetical protein
MTHLRGLCKDGLQFALGGLRGAAPGAAAARPAAAAAKVKFTGLTQTLGQL